MPMFCRGQTNARPVDILRRIYRAAISEGVMDRAVFRESGIAA
jgi:hypothetical protein